MKPQELEKAFLSIATQSIVNTATLNILLRYQARILAHVEQIDYHKMLNELENEIELEIQHLVKKASS